MIPNQQSRITTRYKVWFRRYGRRVIGNPAHDPHYWYVKSASSGTSAHEMVNTLRDIFLTSRDALEGGSGSMCPARALKHIFDAAQAQLTRSDYEYVLDMPNEAYHGRAGASEGAGDIVQARRRDGRREREHLRGGPARGGRRMREINAAIQAGANNAEAEPGGAGDSGDGHIQYHNWI
nr:serine/threonine-protein phosphatase 7 long form homolog [Ipomoea batatas]